WRHLIDRLAGAPAPPPALASPPPPPATSAVGLPRTFAPAAPGGTDRSRVFDPALKHYPRAFRPGDPAFPDPADGRRWVDQRRADGLPGGAVQVDVVFGEELTEPARRVSVPAADGGCVSVRAAGPAQSLAWKLLWLTTDMYPQGKDLYDAVLLAGRFRLPLA